MLQAISSAVNGSKIFYFPCVIKPDKVYQKIYKQIRTIEDINDNHEFNMILKDIDSSGCKALAGKQCRYTYTERTKREALADNSTEFKIITDKVLLYSAKPLLFKVNHIVQFDVSTAQEILKQISYTIQIKYLVTGI